MSPCSVSARRSQQANKQDRQSYAGRGMHLSDTLVFVLSGPCMSKVILYTTKMPCRREDEVAMNESKSERIRQLGIRNAIQNIL